MRIRNRSAVLTFPTGQLEWKNGNQRPKSYSAIAYSDESEGFMDDVRPGYFKALRTGSVLPVGPMEQSKVTREIIGASFTASATRTRPGYPPNADWLRVTGSSVVPWVLPWSALTPPPWPTLNQDAIVTSALANAQTNAWDMLTFAAEFNTTVSMFRTALTRYRQHFNRVFRAAKSRRKDVSNVADLFSQVWLEYRFGLRPILYDIEAINEMLRRLKEGAPVLSRGWSTQSDESLRSGASRRSGLDLVAFNGVSPSTVTSVGASGGYTNHTWLWKRTVSGRASVGVNVTTRDLTMADAPLTLWELTPWSVFVDYFLNIGEILAAYSPAATGTLAFATFSQEMVDEVTQTSAYQFVDNSTYAWSPSVTPPATVVETKIVKVRSLVVPTPSLQLRFDLNASQVLDLIAVAWGLRRRGTSLIKSLASRR